MRITMYDFFTRFVAAGGDVTKLSYAIDAKNDRGIRSVLSFKNDALRVRNGEGDNVYDATDSFLYDKTYEVSIERVFQEGALRGRHVKSKYFRPVKLVLKPKE